MLSVQPLKSAKSAADYYTAVFNYYAGDAQAMRWLGRGAEILGLCGVVEKEQMLALLEGVLPDGQILQNKEGEHRPGFDMTFSAPKSASVLIGLGIKELEIFHDKAVELTISQLEEEFAQTRVVKNGRVHYENTNNFVIAAFRQPSSRANDPDTHTHSVTMNMTFGKDGKVRSLASDIHGNYGVVEQLQQNVKYAGLLYRTNYANLLKDKGLALEEAGDGLFELAGFPEDVAKEFSTRRQEIENYMEENSWSGAKAASAAAVLTRNNKEEHDIAVLKEDWSRRAQALGFEAEKFMQSALGTGEKKGVFESFKAFVTTKFFKQEDLSLIKAREAVEVAIETLSHKSSVFGRRTLKEFALKHSLTGESIIGAKDIDNVIDEKIKSQSLYVGRDTHSNQQIFTTPWLLTLEAESLARIELNKGAVPAITSKKNVLEFQKNYELTAQFKLTASQKQAMTQLLTSNDRYMAIQGYAGVGKTAMLKLTREIAELEGFKLRGLAVASSAANELSTKGGIKSDVFPIVHGELLKANKREFEKTIFIVDEASMLSSPQGHELMKLIEQKNARLYLVGDDDQLPSVKNGRIFGLSQEYGVETAKMVDNIRQKNNSLKEAVLHAIDGEIYDAVRKVNEVREFDTHEKRIEQVAKSYLELSPHVRDNTLVFAPTHENRREITQIIRAGLKEEGHIGKNQMVFSVLKAKPLEEIQLHYAQYYSKGDVIRFNQDMKRFGISRGDYLKVDTLSKENKRDNILLLIHENGKKTNFRLNELPKYKSTRAGFNRHIEVYKQENLELTEGDRILWTRNHKKEGISNSERAIVSSLQDESVTLILDSGEEKTFSPTHMALKHMDYGYVFTNVKVQGKDKMYGIGLMESYNKLSATLRNFYVQISRGIYSMKLVTDDKNHLIRALEENDDTKKSSIDFVTSEKLMEHQIIYAGAPKALSLDAVIEVKKVHEQIIKDKFKLIEEYSQSKIDKNLAKSSELAHEIISDDKCYRLAKKSLNYGYKSYREDALRFTTSNLSKALSPEAQERLNSVSTYVLACQNTKNVWREALTVDSIAADPALSPSVESAQAKSNGSSEFAAAKEKHQVSPQNVDSTAIKRVHAFNEAIIRNKIAFQIASDIESHKPYLAHYSIGALNRLGVPQHRYDAEEAKAFLKLEKLSEHAAHHQVYLRIQQFFSTEVYNKSEQAFEIKTNSKIAHPYLIKLANEKDLTVDVLWKEINIQAREHADLLFKQTLSTPQQKAFDQIKAYRTLNFELGQLWKSNLKTLENNQDFAQDVKDKIANVQALRNEIAALSINSDTHLPAFKYFGLDPDKIKLQAEKHYCRENVSLFLKSNSNFKEKLAAAERILPDIKGHYPFIKELNIPRGQLSKYLRFVDRQLLFSGISEAQASDYKTVLNYKYESRKAACSWKMITTAKENAQKPAPFLLTNALESTAKRDYLAFQINNNAQHKPLIAIKHILEEEKISQEKFNAHINNHAMRIQEIRTINDERRNLLTQLEGKEPSSNHESTQWHTRWNKLNQQSNKILSQTIYSQALKEHSLANLNITENQSRLVEQFELDENSKYSSSNAIHFREPIIDLTITNEALMANPERTYKAIFGEPKNITSKEMRYSGGLIVTLKGSKAGLWFDFGTGDGGSPLQAIMREQNVGFKEALEIAADLAGTKNIEEFKLKPTTVKSIRIDEQRELKNKIVSAVSIMKGAQPIENTLAERYLKEHRHIENPSALDVKFWPKYAKWLDLDKDGSLIEKSNKTPALVIAARNDKGEITGVQRIYLDEKTANKNTFMTKAKISKGHIKSSAGILQKGGKFETLYVVEGPETGASIAMAHPKATVLVSFGVSNMQNLGKIITKFSPKEIIIAGDNDTQSNSRTFEITIEAQKILAKTGIPTSVKIPDKIDNLEKTDWNDVHKINGIAELKRQLGIEDKSSNITSISQKELEHIFSKNSDKLPNKNYVSPNVNLSNDYSLERRNQDNLALLVDKEIQLKISNNLKVKSLAIEDNQINKNIIKEKDLSLEI